MADADLIALTPLDTLSQADVDAIKGFYNGDLPAIRTSFNASAWLPKLLGTGV